MWINRLTIFLAFAFLASVLSSSAFAVPASPHAFMAEQPDGKKFTARNMGDEWLNWMETEDGYPVVRNGTTGFWEYGIIGQGVGLVPTGAVVGGERPEGVEKISGKKLGSAVPRRVSPLETAGSSGPLRVLNATGTRYLLVILVNFNDVLLSTADWQWALRAFAAFGSVWDYYDEVSYGQLGIAPAFENCGSVNDGIANVTLGYNHPNTGGNTGVANRQLTADAILAADPCVNFASYDTNSSGTITTDELHVMIIAAGYEGASGAGSPSVWAHKWCVDCDLPAVTPPTVDGVTVGGFPGGYTQIGELETAGQAEIGGMVHELGHDFGSATEYLGLIDLYDTDYSSQGIGNWGVMSGGSWNQTVNPGDTPAHPCAWSKYYAGWVTPNQISVPTNDQSFPRVEDSTGPSYGIVRLLADPGGPEVGGAGEYFLIENRQLVGYDAGLPASGLLIWHIDETRTNNENELRKLVDLEEADSLIGGLDCCSVSSLFCNGGDGGDPFPGSTNNRVFNSNSDPNSILYNGTDPGISVSDISNSAAVMTADINLLLGASPPGIPTGVTITNVSSRGARISWNAVPGATRYRVWRDCVPVNLSPLTYNSTTYTYWNDTLAASNTNYCWSVSAVNANGESPRSTPQCRRTALALGYNLVSAPYDTSGLRPTQVYGSWASTSAIWRSLGSVSPTINGYWEWNPTIEPGTSQWVWNTNDSRVLRSSLTTPNDSLIAVTLVPGWNMVSKQTPGDMTNIDYYWRVDNTSRTLSDAISAGEIFGTIYWYSAGLPSPENPTLSRGWRSYTIVDDPVIEPWKGYYLLNNDSIQHTLYIWTP